jgi:hypothetical protein
MKRFVSVVAVLCFLAKATGVSYSIERPPAPNLELNTLLMHSTFLIVGPSKADLRRQSFGTIFAMALPKKDKPNEGTLVLVTAAQVLNDIDGDKAAVLVRRKENNGAYTAFQTIIDIRKNSVPLYLVHPTADVAVMYGTLPDDVPITGVIPDFLADDKRRY